MNCFHCGATSFTRNGVIKGKQRYRCKQCGTNQFESERKKITKVCKRLAVILYLNGVKISNIARLLTVSHVAVLKWLYQHRHELDSLRQSPDVATTRTLQSLSPLSKPILTNELQQMEQQIYNIIFPS